MYRQRSGGAEAHAGEKLGEFCRCPLASSCDGKHDHVKGSDDGVEVFLVGHGFDDEHGRARYGSATYRGENDVRLLVVPVVAQARECRAGLSQQAHWPGVAQVVPANRSCDDRETQRQEDTPDELDILAAAVEKVLADMDDARRVS